MVITNMIKKSFLFLLVAHTIGHSFEPLLAKNPPQIEQAEQSVETIEQKRATLKSVFDVLIHLDRVLEQIALTVTKQKIKGLTKIEEAFRILQEMRMTLVGTIQQQAIILNETNPENIHQITITLTSLAKKLVEYFDDLLDNGLTEFPKFDFNEIITRSGQKNLPVNEVERRIKSLTKEVMSLQEKTDFINLTWYNIATRRFEKNVLEPWEKYHLGTASKVAGITGLVGFMLAWEFGSSYLNNQIKIHQEKYIQTEIEKNPKSHAALIRLPFEAITQSHYNAQDTNQTNQSVTLTNYYPAMKQWKDEETKFIEESSPLLKSLYTFCGPTLPTGLGGAVDTAQQSQNSSSYGKFSYFMHLVESSLNNRLPFIALTGAFALSMYKDAWGSESSGGGISAWLADRKAKLWNKLRGGAYAQTVNFFDFVPTVTFDDVIGLDEVKEELAFLLNFIENPEMFIRSGQIPERGYLMTGPTRTGKSFIIEALCGEINKRLKALSREKIFKFRKIMPWELKFKGLELLLMEAKAQGPIVLWIDEIDLLNLQRINNSDNLQNLLMGMGNSFDNDPSKLVILVATTNRPELMDIALKQPGRFGKEIRFEYPPAKYRREYINREFLNMALDPRYFDVEGIVQKTEGQSFEALRALIRGSAIKAWIRGTVLNQELLDEMIDIEIRRMIPIDRKALPAAQKEILAVHFAGKALAYMLLDTEEKLDKVTIRALAPKLREEIVFDQYMKDNPEEADRKKIEYGAVFTKYPYDTIHLKTYEQSINHIKILLAGFVAERIMFGASNYACHPEYGDQADRIARDIALEGRNIAKLGKKQVDDLGVKADKIRQECLQQVEELLRTNRHILETIANTLGEQLTLTQAEIEEIISSIQTQTEEVEQEMQTEPAA